MDCAGTAGGAAAEAVLAMTAAAGLGMIGVATGTWLACADAAGFSRYVLKEGSEAIGMCDGAATGVLFADSTEAKGASEGLATGIAELLPIPFETAVVAAGAVAC